jgi:hypothetical protein
LRKTVGNFETDFIAKVNDILEKSFILAAVIQGRKRLATAQWPYLTDFAENPRITRSGFTERFKMI